MPAETVREFLLTHGVEYEIHDHPLAYEAQRLAEVEHVSGHCVAKPVLLRTGDRIVMVVVPASHTVDLTKAKATLGADDVRLATEDEFAASFADCDVGAEPPLGNLYGVRTFVDRSLDAERVYFRGGTHVHTISMRLNDYLTTVRPEVVDVASAV